MITKKILFVSFMVLTLNNCVSIRQNKLNLSDECNYLKEVIKKNWNKNESQNYYMRNDDFLLKLQRDYRECIIGLNRNQIITLFGKPFEESDLEISYYFLDKGCLDVLPEECEMLIFYHDKSEDKKVISYDIKGHVYHD